MSRTHFRRGKSSVTRTLAGDFIRLLAAVIALEVSDSWYVFVNWVLSFRRKGSRFLAVSFNSASTDLIGN